MTSKENILSEIKQQKRELQNLGIVRMELFGLCARVEYSEKGDIIIEFETEKENLNNYVSAYNLLENLFRNEKNEIVIINGLSSYFDPQILKKVIYA